MTNKIILANGKFMKQNLESEYFSKLDFDIEGKTLIEFAISRILDGQSRNILAIPEDYELTNLKRYSEFIKICKLSPHLLGALATLAMLVDDISSDTDILILPVDSMTSLDHEVFLKHFKAKDCDAGLVTFTSESPNFSYVRSLAGEVIEIAEKRVISSEATTGILYLRNLDLLLELINWSFVNAATTNGLYYVAPALNYLISSGKRISTFHIESEKYYRFSTLAEATDSKRRLSLGN
jgi:hypothetical protein